MSKLPLVELNVWPNGLTLTWQNFHVTEFKGRSWPMDISLPGVFSSLIPVLVWKNDRSLKVVIIIYTKVIKERSKGFYKVRKVQIEIFNLKFNFPTWNFAISRLTSYVLARILNESRKNYIVDFDINFRPNSNYATSVILRLLFKIVNK